MDGHDIHWTDRSGMAALAGLFVAILAATIATVPAQWLIASLMLVVLAMPALLFIEPALQRVRQTTDLPLS